MYRSIGFGYWMALVFLFAETTTVAFNGRISSSTLSSSKRARSLICAIRRESKRMIVPPSVECPVPRRVNALYRRELLFVSSRTFPIWYFLVSPTHSLQARAASAPPQIQTMTTTYQNRVEEIGSGFDLLSPPPLKAPEALYPASCVGIWHVEREITSIEGDSQIARTLWRLLGGSTGEKNKFVLGGVEEYETKFVPFGSRKDGDGAFSIVDRAFEIISRKKLDFAVYKDNSLTYPDTILTVVQRSIEEPNDLGFGSNELIKIFSRETPPLGNILRAARVQRRFRRGFDQDGKRILEGIEIVKTYRVLDGIAGVEMPTSTVKSRLVLRPQPES